MSNPLLDTAALPRFGEIRPEHVAPAVEALLAEANAALERATGADVPADYDALSAVLDVATERLGRAWGAVSHLNAVADTPELRVAYTEALPRVTEFYTNLGADERLYAKYKAVAGSPAAATLNAARRKALSNAMRDFVLSGAELQGAAKERFAAIQARQAELGQAFSEHVLDATDGWSFIASEAELAGVPEDVKAATRAAARADGQDGHKLGLHMPVYLPVLQYAQDRSLRERVYRAHVTRASEAGPTERDNSAVMGEILTLRQEEAALLGYRNFAEVSLVAKMADSPAQVQGFLRDLARRARPHAERDLAELREFARTELGLADLQAWDMAYAAERLKEARYAFSDTEVKQYFTEPKVLAGLFRIIETLFEVAIRPDTAPVWNEHVRFFRIERGTRLVGQFYLDPYARPGKRPGAWMDDVRGRWARPEGTVQTPVAHLVCNFAAPVGDRPALLSHDDVTTLFHEFGHGLHHMLTQVDEIGVAGISGVEWDAVELPSQFMENFCWEWEVVKHMTAHVDSGDPLPRALFDKMLAAKNFQSGLQTLRQVEFSLFDMLIHDGASAAPYGADAIQRVLDGVRREIAVIVPPAFNRFQHSFSHIFAGGYAAGYYSYKWAEVLSADAYAAFEEEGVFNPAVGRRYREAILEAGGSRPAMESFKAFRGREPRIDALLRHQGMAD
ncbi:M3 family metallopeptidase [Methylibium petroleiphilum]|uniref:M3 family metallopeptidase n=1 Tax=Methylibium petroleiphilum TaxID=105560 RepID=UPI001AD1F4BC|nr:M3 family metallopeptidase [Methylibium petroleiphilum]MBN9206391.1 M3 family metallopeptidase [Methylibium petroleiphilum]